MVAWAENKDDDFDEVAPELQLEIVTFLNDRLAPLKQSRDREELDPYIANQVGEASANTYLEYFSTDMAFNNWLQAYLSVLVFGWLHGADL